MRRPNRSPVLVLACTLALGLASQAAAEKSAPWLHLRVSTDEGVEKVNLNVPFSLAQGLLDMADMNEFTADISSSLPEGMSIEKLRTMWRDLEKGGVEEFLNVDSGEDRVSMSLEGDKLRLRVSELKGGLMAEKVQLDIPKRLVDVLLAGQGETLDLRGALDELRSGGIGDILHVRDGGETVRLWIE